jgi:hypothetical protein
MDTHLTIIGISEDFQFEGDRARHGVVALLIEWQV